MEYQNIVEDADLLITHAGMGGILTALELGKPIVLLARRAAFGEHRNDHQLATANKFFNFPQIFVAATEKELPAKIEMALREPVVQAKEFDKSASPELVSAVRDFVIQDAVMR